MSRVAVAVLIAAFAAAGAFATPSDAATKRKHPERHAAQVAAVAAAPAPYGLPGTYYPAPPFPFFLLPGPWWLPAHP